MSRWWVHAYVQDGQVIELVSQVFWVIFSITLHELGHGWAALRQGDDTPRRLGHMTLNPVVHMGVPALVVFALCGITWGLMPVDPGRFRDRRYGELKVAAAGPAVNVALALACLLLLLAFLRLYPPEAAGRREVAVFLFSGCSLNLVLAGLNLLPIPPLDGSRMAAALSFRLRMLYAHPNAPTIGLFVFIALFFLLPFGGIYLGLFDLLAWVLAELGGAVVGAEPLAPLLYGD